MGGLRRRVERRAGDGPGVEPLEDRVARRGADPVGAGFEHRKRRLEAPDPAARLYREVLRHYLDVRDGRAAAGEAGRGLEKRHAGLLGEFTRGPELPDREQRGLDDSLHRNRNGRDDPGEFVDDRVGVAVPKPTDVEDDIDPVRAVHPGTFGLELLRFRGRLAVREPADGHEGHAGRVLGRVGDVTRRNAGVHPVALGLVERRFDVSRGRSRAENGMIDPGGERVTVHAVIRPRVHINRPHGASATRAHTDRRRGANRRAETTEVFKYLSRVLYVLTAYRVFSGRAPPGSPRHVP